MHLARPWLLAWIATLLLALPCAVGAQDQEPSLLLEQVLPEEAFQRLGARYGAEFQLLDGQQWIGPEANVRASADLRELTFWQAILKLAELTGYEPVFQPYGRTGDGRPVVWLRRVDVGGEEQAQPAIAAGPLLIRPTGAHVHVSLKMAQIRMTPPQAAVRLELFLEPNVSAVYVMAAAVRGEDEEKAAFRRGEGHDPAVGMEDGVGEMLLYFDVVRRIPTSVARWQALMRVVESLRVEHLAVPVRTVAEEPSPGAAPGESEPPPATRSASAPPEGTPHDLGPYRIVLDPVLLAEREAAAPDGAEASPATRRATLQLTVPRGELDHMAWGRLYGFLVSLPPSLALDPRPEARHESPWRLTGYAVVSIPSPEDPDVAGLFKVWAQYEAEAGAPDPAALLWTLPVESAEQRFPVVWQRPLTIDAEPARPKRPLAPGAPEAPDVP